MEQPRILKEHAGEDDFYRLLTAFSSYRYIVALWSHSPHANKQSTDFPLHYFENEGWIAASNNPISSVAEATNLTALRNSITNNQKHLFGFFSYDLKNEIEELHSTGPDPFGFPDFWFFEPELLIRFQNERIECFNADEAVLAKLFNVLHEQPTETNHQRTPVRAQQSGYRLRLEPTDRNTNEEMNDKQRSGQHSTAEFRAVVSREEYQRNVEVIRKHIKEGDVYELNYCIEWHAETVLSAPVDTWKDMNKRTNAPFAAFLRMNEHYVLSASPERFMRKSGSVLYSQPIKGTAPRHPHPSIDAANARQLSANKKERAENLMIVDLVRNDLSKSCKAGSVQVPELCKVFALQTVHQMCSTVCGELQEHTHPLEAILSAFPMGSMTGAPKISAMQIIDRLETFKRGIFSGSIGYFTPHGDFDFNVVIRSLLYRSDTHQAVVRTGSAITFDSNPEQEWEECLMKAKAIIEMELH